MINPEIRYRELKKVVLSIIGDSERNRDALDHRREDEFVIWRSIIAYQMHTEGFSLTSIGKSMGRQHGTISYHVSTMRNIFSERLVCNRDVIEKYSKFKQEMGNEDDRIIMVHLREIRSILDDCGLQQSEVDCIIKNIKQL